ncbi:MAG: hypothetical protein SGILL_007126, partial [Bacillariaceae sp.]
PTEHNDGQFYVELKKVYSAPLSAAAGKQKGKKGKKKKKNAVEEDPNVLPDPSPVFDREVVCLQGKVTKETSDEIVGIGSVSTVTRIVGLWGNGLNIIEADPQNNAGQLGKFEYEHKSSSNPGAFPVNGRYSGFFTVNQPDGSRVKVAEKDVQLKFRKNNKGYYNVEGKGSNPYGKYSITGSLSDDNVITIFRHFALRKVKASRPVTSAPPPINEPTSRRPSIVATPVKDLSLDDVKIPEVDSPPAPLEAPENGAYGAVTRGIFRMNDDGSHGCQAKWALTREHLTEVGGGRTSSMNIRLEAHFVEEAIKRDPTRTFPVDSDRYKGSFQLKKGSGSRYSTVVDDQVVMKFVMNNQGAFNVYGRGVNSIGIFILTGSLLPSGKSAGQMELYRSYPADLLKPQPAPVKSSKRDSFAVSSLPPASGRFPAAPRPGIARRESTRTIKVPSRLEDDDPDALQARLMDKCMGVLRLLRTKDNEYGGFFEMPVDPVALKIPTYFKVIKEPMDLNTLEAKMVAEDVNTPDEFARLARLTFENAIKFNEDPTHSVNNSARQLLIFFNQKYSEIERSAKHVQQIEDVERRKGKGDKKRKRAEEPKSLKQRRIEEAQSMAAANAIAMSQLVSAAPIPVGNQVTRTEFNMLMGMVGKLQSQVVESFNLIASLSSDDPTSGAAETAAKAAASVEYGSQPTEKKKQKKKTDKPKATERPAVIEDEALLDAEEQEFLTHNIVELPEDAVEEAMAIIRAHKVVGADDSEIDLDLDALPPVVQRKLYKHVTKFIKHHKKKTAKAPRGKAVKAQPKKQAAKKPAKATTPTVQSPVASPVPAHPKPDPNSFFSFGGNQDSDSDSDSEDGAISENNTGAAAASQPVGGAKAFRLDGLGDDDDDDDDSVDANGGTTNWDISAVETKAEKKDGDEDDAWGAAREEALAAKAREEDKKKREEKLKAEAEQDKKARMAEAVDVAEKKKAERLAKEAEDARLQEEKEKEAEAAREKARKEAREKVQSVEQTVDLDEERDLMKQLEQNYMDTEMGGASPSSDFGF